MTLTMSERPKPVVDVHPDGRVFRGETVTLTCDTQQTGVWQYIWYKDRKLVYNLPRSTLTVTPDSPVFTGETVTLKCVINSDHSDWRYEWYKGRDSVMLQTSDHYTVNRDTLTIRRVITSDQDQYTCRGQRDKSPKSSQSSSASLSVTDLPRSTLTVTPDSPVFTGETVNLTCLIESYSNWRYEWYKGRDSVMLQTSDRYTVNRDTLTIRRVITADQDQYTCRGQRDKRPNSSQESNRIHLSVNASSSLLVTGVVVGSSVCLLFFISLLLLWRYKKNKDQQRNINQTSVPNQSAESQPEKSPLQSGSDHIYDDVTEVNKRDKDINTAGPSDLVYAQIDLQDKKKTKGKGAGLRNILIEMKSKDKQRGSDHIYDVVTEVNKRDKGDPEPLADVTYSEVTVKKNKKKMDKDDSMAEPNDVTYSEVRNKVKKSKRNDINTAGPSDLVYAQIDLQDKKKTKGKGAGLRNILIEMKSEDKQRGKSSESGDTLYSDLKHNTDRGERNTNHVAR
ncbi:uncharacterized protein LOC107747084 [Sinocyclocheilus rhinocerous]|uniref:uncharacterized protein LOC107747084 n=1 Tax=Sinocyclocheilus rhinocerous TaxID=307959 RepID=UPI0007B822F7|nr:PREDICTED: uncharacterized protein LOC107747084 [Sinocyclocheilus rhinocerous]